MIINRNSKKEKHSDGSARTKIEKCWLEIDWTKGGDSMKYTFYSKGLVLTSALTIFCFIVVIVLLWK